MTTLSWLWPSLGLLSNAPHDHGILSVFRKTGQGAFAGALGLSGAGALGASSVVAAPSEALDLSSLEGISAGLLGGGLNHQLQLLAAALIFLAAGRCVARMFGLGLAVLAFLAWREGMTSAEILTLLKSLWLRLSAAYAAFMNPPGA